MLGITSLIGLKPADDKSIQLFSNTNKDQLSLALKSGTSDGEDSNNIISTQAGDLPGNLINSSQLSSAEILGIKFVVGFTKHPESDDFKYLQNDDVSLISPVYRSIKQVIKGNTSVAMSSAGHLGFVYFTDGVKQNEIYKTNPLDQSAEKLPGVVEVLSKTSLAAYYNPESKKHYVIYQSEKGTFSEYDVSSEQNTPISGTLDSKANTPLAVVYSSEKKQVFLYYTDRNRSLHKVIKSGSDWKNASEVNNVQAVGPESQIAVTNSDGVNHLFYVPVDQAQIEHFKDPITA